MPDASAKTMKSSPSAVIIIPRMPSAQKPIEASRMREGRAGSRVRTTSPGERPRPLRECSRFVSAKQRKYGPLEGKEIEKDQSKQEERDSREEQAAAETDIAPTCGVCRHPSSAPSSVPSRNAEKVVVKSRPIVQGSAVPITSQTVTRIIGQREAQIKRAMSP